ncbi:DUF4153 domain-containing protein [Cellulomonas sp. KRMCY2]|uniref:DUF4153 domain-containing protein n=1 Tax=Cellulomonas sp. KRMCY2 TaxID=1304865 RepID=UPI0009DCB737|nr:DUF4173 domain-containing protein [Cellulomonas sp. KRMCY2]
MTDHDGPPPPLPSPSSSTSSSASTAAPLPVPALADVPLVAPSAWQAPAPSAALPRTGPTTALAPRERSPFARSLTAFWGERHRTVPTGVLVTVVVAGVAGGGLVVGHRLGLGAALVGLLAWAAAVPALVRRRAVGDLVTAALSVALLGVVAVSDADWVVALCLATAAWAGAVAATSARSAPAVALSGISWAFGVVRALPWLTRAAGTLAGSRRGQLLVALRSVAVTGVLLVVFGLLFASADRVFASYLPRLDADLLPAQTVIGILVALTAATLAHLALAPPGWSSLTVRAGRPARRGEWLLPILALDAMVLGFVLVQIGALLGGHRHVLETAGLSYAEYAREGFAQLVAVTALTLLVVAVAVRRAPRVTDTDRAISRAALVVLCVGTLGVVASALRRMDLYVEAFGLTRLRLYVVAVEVVLAAILVLVMVAGVRWRGSWLPRAVVQVVAVAMLGLAVVNPDALIVRHNTTADLDVALDVSYLQGLSADAVPAMDDLEEPLRSCLLASVDVGPSEGLADWNLGRSRAAGVLAEASVAADVATACPQVYQDR